MSRLTQVTLGGNSYEVPQLEIDQYEELMDLWEDEKKIDAADAAAKFKSSIKAIAIMLRHSSPAIADIRKLRCSLAELSRARLAIMAAAGLVAAPNGADPGNGEAAAGAASTSTSSLPN